MQFSWGIYLLHDTQYIGFIRLIQKNTEQTQWSSSKDKSNKEQYQSNIWNDWEEDYESDSDKNFSLRKEKTLQLTKWMTL